MGNCHPSRLGELDKATEPSSLLSRWLEFKEVWSWSPNHQTWHWVRDLVSTYGLQAWALEPNRFETELRLQHYPTIWLWGSFLTSQCLGPYL